MTNSGNGAEFEVKGQKKKWRRPTYVTEKKKL